MLPRKYDVYFEKHRSGIPIEYLRALAKRESGMNHLSNEGSARGLMQVVEVVRKGHNAREKTSYSRADLLNPDVNVEIGAGLLKRIAAAFNKHPSQNMKTDWSNPEFVKLLTAGWNSGYSEAGGVGKIASYLEKRNIPVTHDAVFANWAKAQGSRPELLAKTAKRNWQRGVAAQYFAELKASGGGGPARPERPPGGASSTWEETGPAVLEGSETIVPTLGKPEIRRAGIGTLLAGLLGFLGFGWLLKSRSER